MTTPEHQRLLIVDFGSQVTQLIARRLREVAHLLRDPPLPEGRRRLPRRLPPAGRDPLRRPGQRHRAGQPARRARDLHPRRPGPRHLLRPADDDGPARRHGRSRPPPRVRPRLRSAPPTTHDPLFTGLFQTGREEVWMSHGDRVTALAPGFAVIGASPNAPFAITTDPRRHFYAVQFHPEVHHTVNGARILQNFTDLAGFTGDWTMAAYKDQAIAAIRAQVGDARVICGLSGGVDSLGRRRADPRGDRRPAHLRLRRHRPDAPGRGRGGRHPVPRPLQHPADPRRRERPLPRRARRRRRPRDQAQDHRPPVHRGVRGHAPPRSATPQFLAQGTLYPDVIESVSFTGGPSVTIKSHHNVGGLPERMNLKLVEPLRELFKDEVRALGRELGLPASLRRPPPLPRPRPRHPLPRRRSPARSSPSCARPTRSTSTRSAATASTTPSGRPSPCCCRCAPSASWATAAPTTTSARSAR